MAAPRDPNPAVELAVELLEQRADPPKLVPQVP
jgi:hypothetical protein